MAEDAGTLTSAALVSSAVDWMTDAIERGAPVPPSCAEIGTVARQPRPGDERVKIVRIANMQLGRPPDPASLHAESPEELAAEICRAWRSDLPEAEPVARAWLLDDVPSLEPEMIHMRNLLFVIGIAAGASVLALVLIARRRGGVTLRGRDRRVSADFELLRRCSSSSGLAADIASRTIDSEPEPWSFQLENLKLSAAECRLLLADLSREDQSIEAIIPAPGSPLNPEEMTWPDYVDAESNWVVSEHTAHGYRRRGSVLIKAEVSPCTADWWALARSDADCPVARKVAGNPEHYTGLDASYALRWTAPEGLRALADLRSEFDEKALEGWRVRMGEEMSRWYGSRADRSLRELGVAGDPYDSSIMKAKAGSPAGSARVVSVVERDGIAQRGLGCPGSPPLLYAVVEWEET